MLLAAVALDPRAARAEEISALYHASYLGLTAGEIRFRFGGSGDDYRDEIAIESTGLAHLVTHFRGSAVAEGSLGVDGHAAPLSYDALYDLRKRHDSRIAMRFIAGEDGVIAERDASDTSRKPPLDTLYRRDVVDPISALAAIRHALQRERAAPPHDLTVPVYDGARRFDVLVHRLPAEPGEPVIRLRLTLLPIAGFKGESSDDGNPEAYPRPVDVVVTDDAKLIPISIRVPIWHFLLTVSFDRFCASFEACGKPAP